MKHRAISNEQKEERRLEIVEAVDKLFQEAEFQKINMNTIAQKAGVAKGTLFFYFKTKEELFLYYAYLKLKKWNDDVDAELLDLTLKYRSVSITSLVEIITKALKGKKSILKLLSILGSIIERNIDFNASLEFKTFLKKRMKKTGLLFENLLSFFKPGDGQRFYLYIFFTIVGLYPSSDPSPIIKKVIEEPGMEIFKVDFESVLKDMLIKLLKGWK